MKIILPHLKVAVFHSDIIFNYSIKTKSQVKSQISFYFHNNIQLCALLKYHTPQ